MSVKLAEFAKNDNFLHLIVFLVITSSSVEFNLEHLRYVRVAGELDVIEGGRVAVSDLFIFFVFVGVSGRMDTKEVVLERSWGLVERNLVRLSIYPLHLMCGPIFGIHFLN